jgi:hypothetical protein
VNRTDDAPNPYKFSPSEVNASDFRNFPHSWDNASWTNKSRWKQSGVGTQVPAEVEAADGVDALRFDHSADQHSEFDLFSITSDENKRFGQVVAEVDSLDANAVVEVRFVDGDGDYKMATINSSASRMDDHVIANETGTVVWQHQLGKLDTMSSSGSDGTFDNIEAVNVTTTGGAADLTFAALNVDKMSEWQFGEMKYQADSDDKLETKTLTEPAGMVEVHDLDTLGSTFDDAVIKWLEYSAQYRASDADSDDFNVSAREVPNDYPGYKYEVVVEERLSAVDAYDVQNQNLSLKENQTLKSNRYVAVEVAEGTGGTNFSNISDDSYVSVTSKFSNGQVGDVHELDDTIQPGQEVVVKHTLKLTEEDMSNLREEGDFDGGGGYYEDSSSGGSQGFFEMLFGGILSFLGLGGIIKARRKGSGS